VDLPAIFRGCLENPGAHIYKLSVDSEDAPTFTLQSTNMGQESSKTLRDSPLACLVWKLQTLGHIKTII
jgi:hypothetical protein